ncbi:MAG TPA: right-handed parallel beta-helix repeat-containing protein [Ktedonobacterales bacterium]|nr:right-handed parallel beta-helix repeat-containing protein [Ktedonobacterales bacterium]
MSRPRSPGRRRPALVILAFPGVLALFLALPLLALAGPIPVAQAQSPAANPAANALCPPGSPLRATLTSPPAQFAHVVHVPGDQPTIQAAVDAAQAGDLILVAPGVYHEAVRVCRSDITIRGEDRNGTVLDGQSKLTNGFTVLADNVIIENMTAHHYVGNGFYWTDQTGYRGSYLTAYDNGDYGIYAFGSQHGEFDRSYASGSPDSGFYIGQCYPCDAIITDVISEWNGLGYSGTNAGGNLVIQNSEWSHNSAGIVPNTLDSEKGPPERGTTIINNYVHDNGNEQAPYNLWSHIPLGDGILVPGGDLNYIANNRVVNNSEYGILVLGNIDKNFWLASGNVVRGNAVSGSGVADLGLAAPSGANNCFADNKAATTVPPLLEVTHPCGSPITLAGGGDIGVTMRLIAKYLNTGFSTPGPSYNPPDFRQVAAPKSQPNMPDVNAPPGPIFTDAFPTGTTSEDGIPPAAAAYTSGYSGGTAMFQPLGFSGYSIVQILLSFYGNALFFALYAAWLAVAFVELGQRQDLSAGKKLGWGVLALAVPIIGPIIYYFAGGSKLSARFKLALIIGAPLLLLAVTVLLLVLASYTLL